MRSIIILLGVATAAASAGDVYKWTDGKGDIHYGDQPPAAAQRVHTDAGAAAPNPPGNDLRPGERALLDRLERWERKRLRARQASARKDQAAATHHDEGNEWCTRTRNALHEYEDERRQGCHPKRCAYIDRMIARGESRIRARCQ